MIRNGMKSPLPVFSIVTVVFNREHDIEFTLKSVTEQTYPHIEYIVVDGKSSDNTLNILKKYESKIHHLISEPDNGIYDAMNKGLSKASGDYVLFLNGGDQLHQLQTIENIVNSISNESDILPDIIFGECMLINQKRQYLNTRSFSRGQILPDKLEHNSFIHGTNVSHQCFIVKREIAPFYQLKYKWSSDVDWMLQCLRISNKSYMFNEIISDFVVGDSSEHHKLSSIFERFKIMIYHYGIIKTIKSHAHIVIKNMKNLNL